jgi:hypothetical protein
MQQWPVLQTLQSMTTILDAYLLDVHYELLFLTLYISQLLFHVSLTGTHSALGISAL